MGILDEKTSGRVINLNAVRAPDPLISRIGENTVDMQVLAQAHRQIIEHALALANEAQQVVTAHRKRISELESLVMTDELTNLYNRRGFFSLFRRELAAAKRSSQAEGVLILCDLDGFKMINDTYGHPTGDTYLREVARQLTAHVRPTDVVARLGGDEFAILLTRTDPTNGLRRAAEIEEQINTRVLLLDDAPLPLRISCGAQPYDGSDTEEIIMRFADNNLYATKSLKGAARAMSQVG